MGNILDSYPQLFYRIARVVFYIGQHLWLAQMEFKVNPPYNPWAYLCLLGLFCLFALDEACALLRTISKKTSQLK